MIFLVSSSLDMSELAKQAKKKLQAVSVWPSYFFSYQCPTYNRFWKYKKWVPLHFQLPNHLFEELAMDVYDEVDRRENDERK